MNCPECNNVLIEREERFPECEACGFVLYDADSLALQAEVRREQAQAKAICGYIPSWEEWSKR